MTESSIQDETINGAKVSYRVQEGTLVLFSLRVPQRKRRQGLAHGAMRYLTEKADSLGLAMKLDASPLDARTRTDKLVRFYEGYGFVCTGATVNPVGDPEMKRPATTS